MRRLLLLLTLAAGLVLAPAAASATGITISSTGFQPKTVTVQAGTTVTWTNGDAARHQVVANNGSFSSPVLTSRQSYAHAFRAGGTFAYHDGLHPSLRGTVTVIPPRTVWITRAGFEPSSISIQAGQSVRWVNKSNANQQVTASDASFVSPVLASGQSYSHTFAGAGSFAYRDALEPSLTGTVVVAAGGAAEAITLSSVARAVTYGRSLVLRGTVANGTAGEKASVTVNPQAGKFVKSVQTVTVAADGSFSVTVRPLVNTVYVAGTAKSHSDPLAISVRPSVRIGRISHRRAVVRVSAARSFTHKYALLQYWRARRSVWVTVGRVRLTQAVFGVSPTVTTSGVVRLHIRHRLRLRAWLPTGQAAPGYVSGFSNIIRS